MLLNKHNFTTKNFIDSTSQNPEIRGILINSKETVATDGYSLIKVQKSQDNFNEFPKVQKRKPLKEFPAFILPKEEMERLLKLLPKQQSMSVLENVSILKKTKDYVEFGITDLANQSVIKSRIIQGTYPEYQKLFTKKGRHIKISVNPIFLKRIADFFTAFNDKVIPQIEIEIPIDPTAPIHFSGEKNKQKATALLMPLKK